MEHPFIASNGVEVKPAHTSAIHVHDNFGGLNITPERDVALREYYRAEEDEQFDRVRMPEYPNVAIYPRKNSPWITVFDEAKGEFREASSTSFRDNTDAIRAARLYFSRLPKPLPKTPGTYGHFELGDDGRWREVARIEVSEEYVDQHLPQDKR